MFGTFSVRASCRAPRQHLELVGSNLRSIETSPRGRPFVSDYTVFARSECIHQRCVSIRESRTAIDGRRLDVQSSGHVSTVQPALDELRSVENPGSMD